MRALPPIIRRTGVVLALFTLAGCDAFVERHVAAGDAYYADHKFRDAIDEYVKAARVDPDNPRILRPLGLAYFQAGDLQNAFSYLTKVEVLKPEDTDARLVVASIYIANRRPDQAIREANTVLAAHPSDTAALTLLGSAYLNKRDPASAADTYRKLIQLDARIAQPHYQLGVALDAQGNTAAAKAELDSSLALTPGGADATAKLVGIAVRENQLDEALRVVQQQVAAAPGSAPLVNLLGVVQSARGDAPSAEAAFREAIRLDPHFTDARVALANFYGGRGRGDLALATIDQALEADQRTAAVYTVRGVILQQRGDLANAQKAYEQALAIDPYFVTAANNLAWLLSEKLGKHAQAERLARIAVAGAPDDPNVADTRGWILYRLGDYAQAVRVLQASADKQPANATASYHLGMALAKSGDAAAARRALNRAASSPADSPSRDSARKALALLP